MHEDRFRVAVAMTCADCGLPIPAGDKGVECPTCKRWPLCAKCLKRQHDHSRDESGSRHNDRIGMGTDIHAADQLDEYDIARWHANIERQERK